MRRVGLGIARPCGRADSCRARKRATNELARPIRRASSSAAPQGAAFRTSYPMNLRTLSSGSLVDRSSPSPSERLPAKVGGRTRVAGARDFDLSSRHETTDGPSELRANRRAAAGTVADDIPPRSRASATRGRPPTFAPAARAPPGAPGIKLAQAAAVLHDFFNGDLAPGTSYRTVSRRTSSIVVMPSRIFCNPDMRRFSIPSSMALRFNSTEDAPERIMSRISSVKRSTS